MIRLAIAAMAVIGALCTVGAIAVVVAVVRSVRRQDRAAAAEQERVHMAWLAELGADVDEWNRGAAL
jgi:hypothetical protein